jgi:acyl-CoA synthetase (AMP-forming)/AMP-acid ligase II
VNSCDFTIYDMIVRNAELYQEKCALVYGDVRISFSRYKKLCDCCAAGLIREGISVGDRIAVLSSNCEDFMVLCGAAAKVGAIVVAINVRLSVGELDYIFQDTTPKYLFSSNEFRDQMRSAASSAGLIRKHFVFKPDPGDGDFIPFDSLLAEDTEAQGGPVVPGDAYMIIHTAAVGGNPRGCVLSQANMLSVGLQTALMFSLCEKDCHICILPLFHIGGFSMTLAVMHQGGKNVILDRFDPLLVLKLIEKEKGTFFGSFPPILGTILDAQEKQPVDLSSLRGVGGIDAPDTIQRFLKASPQSAFYGVYGQTEAMPVSSCDVTKKPGSIGLPGIMTRVAIFDDLDREVPAGVQGEICVRSPSVDRKSVV